MVTGYARAVGSGSGELDDTAAASPAAALDETARSGDDGLPAAGDAAALPEVSPRRYRVAGEIGRGGLGRILRARDVHLDRTVALKELLADDERARRRFVREALITARLQHPSIVPVYEAGRWPDHAPFYAMKLVDGKPLSEVLAAAGSLDARLAHVPTVLAVADAIAYAHAERIVHRDLKPHNVLVGAFGETVVIDWGLAKDLSLAEDTDALDAGPYRKAASDQTVDGAVLGTPAYMPPEQAAGEDVDERADVYALGAMLYHVIAGRSPHTGESLERMIDQVVAGEIAPLATVEPSAPADLAAIVAKAMARDAADRYPTARELADDLRRFTTGQLVGAHRYTVGERIGRFLRRHRAIVTLCAIAAAVLAAFAVWSFRKIGAERDTAVAQAREAVDNGNRATLAQARDALGRDPAEALAWLARLDPDGPGWETARVLAADALSRPRLVHLVRGLPGGLLHLETDPLGTRLVASGQGVVAVVELASDTARTYDVPDPHTGDDPPIFAPCTDGRRAFGIGDTPQVLALDTGAVTIAKPTAQRGWLAAQGCLTTWRFQHDTFGDDSLLWWDEKAGAQRVLVARGVLQAWVSPDGRHAYSVDPNGAMVWWDPEHSAAPVPVGPVHSADHLVWPAMSRDGRVALFPWDQPFLRIAGQRLVVQPNHVDVAAVSPDGSQIALTTGRNDVTFGDVQLLDGRGNEDGMLNANGAIHGMTFTEDGRWLLADGDHAVAWELATRARVEVPLKPDDVNLTLPGRQLAVLTRDGSAQVWEPRPAHVIRTLDVSQVAMSRDGRWLVIETQDRITRVDLRGQLPDDVVEMQAVNGPAILSADDVADDGSVVMPTATGNWTWPRGGVPVSLGPSIGYPHLRAAGVALALIDRDVVEIGAKGSTRVVWMVPKGRALLDESAGLDRFALVGDDRAIRVVERATGVEAVVPGSAPPVAFSRDGRWLATAAAGGNGVVVWDVAAHRAQAIAAPRGGVVRLIPSDDGRKVAIVAAASITVVDRDGDAPRVLDPGTGALADAAFDADGRRFATATNHDARLWDLGSGAMRVIADAPALALHFDGDAILLVLERAVIEVRDDLPRDPAALAAALRAQPYELEEAPGGGARVRIRR
jgi:tRNA A-37 threonylcarbamoyl transferase component Bud32